MAFNLPQCLMLKLVVCALVNGKNMWIILNRLECSSTPTVVGALFCRCSVSSSRSFLSRLSIYPLFSHHALFLSNILTMFNWKYVECLLFRISSYVNSISSVRLHKVCAREAEQQQKKRLKSIGEMQGIGRRVLLLFSFYQWLLCGPCNVSIWYQ